MSPAILEDLAEGDPRMNLVLLGSGVCACSTEGARQGGVLSLLVQRYVLAPFVSSLEA